MADAPGKSRSTGARRQGLVLVVVGAIALAALVYFLTRRSGEVPDLPRPRFTADEVERAVAQVEERAREVSLTDDERMLVAMIGDLNRAETAEPVGPESAVEIEGLVKAVGELARARAARNLERYLRLGDAQAVEFDRAVDELLARARRVGVERAMASEAGDELQRLGGSFAARAIERGVITGGGEIDGPALLPLVLFRVRWRALAGVDRREGLSPLEWRAYMDFVLTFSKPSSVETRLQAIDEIADLEPGFDALLARAIVYHEAGMDDDALALLGEAIAGGRDDEAVTGFARSISP
jgi:hypothetical protein